jgi:hypothetical protein
MDNNERLYVVDHQKNEVRRWKIGETKGTIVTGGNHFNQLYHPIGISSSIQMIPFMCR